MVTRLALVVVGQSNEVGNGDTASITYSGPVGNAMRDPVAPNGSTAGSMWPTLAGLCAARDVYLYVHNAAVGGTSLVDSWCGGLRTWVSSMLVIRGSYALSGGNVYKCTVTQGTVGVSTTVPAVGTGADGIPWVLARAAIAEDVDGAVYASGSALFDPNGYFATAALGFGFSGYANKIAYVALGQTDKTLSTSRARFSTAHQNCASYLIAHGAQKVLLGFTCWGNTGGLTAYYDSTLVPGLQDALTAMAGNPKIMSGANLYAELGAQNLVGQANTAPGIFSADNVHMNNPLLKLAAARVDLRLAAAGY